MPLMAVKAKVFDMYSFIHDMRLPCGPHHHNLPRTHDQTTTYPKLSCSRDISYVQQGGGRYAPALVFIRAGWYVPYVPPTGIDTDGRPTEGPVTRVRTAVFTAEKPAT